MHPLMFACSRCGRRMGVGLELVGRSVRCPHCREVVTAPANRPARPVSPSEASRAQPQTPPEAFEPTEDGENRIPTFASPPQEGIESILGDEESDDDCVFAPSEPSKPLLMPDLSLDETPEISSGRIAFDHANPSAQSSLPLGPKELSQPDFELLTRTAPAITPVPAPATPAAMPYTIHPPPPPPRSDDVVDPFAKLGRPSAIAPAPARISSTSPNPDAKTPKRSPPKYFWAILAYALVITLLAAWGWLRPTPHPFSTIPDFFGHYHSGNKNKVAELPVNLNQPFPHALKVKLGQSIVLGELEFEPLRIEHRRTQWIDRSEGGRSRDIDCLVLTARVRNRSNQAFHPFDPAFNRFAATNAPPPLTAVMVNGQNYAGGPIPWPFRHSGREYIVGQEQDEVPLEPGQERTTVLPSIDGAKGRQMCDMLRTTGSPALWRIHLRRGYTNYQGERVSASALVGVEFDASEVRWLTAGEKSS